MSRPILSALFASLVLVGGSGLASAGVKTYSPVKATPWVSNPNMMSVAGSASATRDTADAVQFISCSTSASAGACTYRDLAGKFYTCFTTDPGLLTVIRSMQGDSVMEYDYDVTTGKCSYINVGAHSASEPKAAP
jgi:hypothetical protein